MADLVADGELGHAVRAEGEGVGRERWRVLIRERGARFTSALDVVFTSERGRVIKTAVRTPVANAYAERWISTVCRECLERMLILGATYLGRVLES